MKKFLILFLGIILCTSCIRYPNTVESKAFSERVSAKDSVESLRMVETWHIWLEGSTLTDAVLRNAGYITVKCYKGCGPTEPKGRDGYGVPTTMHCTATDGTIYNGILVAKPVDR